MGLTDFEKKRAKMSDEEVITELINRRRRQILVHSFIYYQMNDNIIDDHMYDRISFELVKLQTDYPEIASRCAYAKEFADFDGSTGFDLPKDYPEIQNRAIHLLNYHKRRLKDDTRTKDITGVF